MKIVCILKREAGTQVTIGRDTYNFQPDENGVHVCEVKSKEHCSILLGIPEGYRAFGKHEEIDQEPEQEQEQEPVYDPPTMNNTQLNAWARGQNINHRSKQSIKDYAEDFFPGVPLDDSRNPAAMIRELLQLIVDDNKAE